VMETGAGLRPVDRLENAVPMAFIR
jgi:hypothetical protein